MKIYLVQFECEIHGFCQSIEEAESYIDDLMTEFDIPEDHRDLFEIKEVDQL